jgi:septum formation protein
LSNLTLLKPFKIASSSSIRKEIISNAGITCEFVSSNVDEEKIKKDSSNLSFSDISLKLASAKALEVSKKNKDFYILGVDQICQFRDEILNKPGNEENCKKTLKKLSGNTHYQNCGMAISFNNEIIWTSCDIAKLTMKDLSESDIEKYVKKDKPFKCCGSYKYELNGKNLFSRIEGSIYTIQGLDIDGLLIYLRQNKFI